MALKFTCIHQYRITFIAKLLKEIKLEREREREVTILNQSVSLVARHGPNIPLFNFCWTLSGILS